MVEEKNSCELVRKDECKGVDHNRINQYVVLHCCHYDTLLRVLQLFCQIPPLFSLVDLTLTILGLMYITIIHLRDIPLKLMF